MSKKQMPKVDEIQIIQLPLVSNHLLVLAEQIHQLVITLLAPGRKSREQIYGVRDTLEKLISDIKCG